MLDATEPDRPRQVADGMWVFPVRTPTLPPAAHTNVYVLGTRQFVVVEPASPEPEEQDALWYYLEERLAAGDRCRAVLLTHHHPDHIGGLTDLRNRLEAPVLAHAETARLLGNRFAFDGFLEEGDGLDLEEAGRSESRRIDVFHTPGHAPGHLCFVDRVGGCGVVGDMVAGVGTILIDPYDGDMSQYLDSLERMKGFGMQKLLPAHGPELQEPERLLDRYVAHRLMREDKVLQAVEGLGRPGSIEDLVPVAYDDTPPMLYPLAARSLESHLRKLVRDGRVVCPEPGRYAAED